MEGEKVKISALMTDCDGDPLYDVEVSEKPQFMLKEEYDITLLNCVANAVAEACRTVTDDPESRLRYIDYIMNMAKKRV